MKYITITSDGISPKSIEVLTPEGKKLQGVTDISISLSPDHVNKAEVTLMTIVDKLDCHPSFQIIHPITGTRKRVNALIFEDGEVWNRDEADISKTDTGLREKSEALNCLAKLNKEFYNVVMIDLGGIPDDQKKRELDHLRQILEEGLQHLDKALS